MIIIAQIYVNINHSFNDDGFGYDVSENFGVE